MTIDSRTSQVERDIRIQPIYSTSEPKVEIYNWIQPSIIHQINLYFGTIIDGIYSNISHRQVIKNLDPNLLLEFEAWCNASDEDLLNFECDL